MIIQNVFCAIEQAAHELEVLWDAVLADDPRWEEMLESIKRSYNLEKSQVAARLENLDENEFWIQSDKFNKEYWKAHKCRDQRAKKTAFHHLLSAYTNLYFYFFDEAEYDNLYGDEDEYESLEDKMGRNDWRIDRVVHTVRRKHNWIKKLESKVRETHKQMKDSSKL